VFVHTSCLEIQKDAPDRSSQDCRSRKVQFECLLNVCSFFKKANRYLHLLMVSEISEILPFEIAAARAKAEGPGHISEHRVQ